MFLLLPEKRRRWQKVNCSSNDDYDAPKRSRNELPCSSDHTRLLDPHHLFPASMSPLHQFDLPTPFPHHSHTLHSSDTPVPNPNPGPGKLSTFPEEWETDMISFIAASRLCREEAVACSLLSDGIPDDLPLSPSLCQKDSLKQIAKQKKKKKKTKSSSASGDSSSKALNVSQCNSWRIMKKLLSKQFMPFSTNSRSSKVSTRILHSRNNVLGVEPEQMGLHNNKMKKKLKGKERAMRYGDENRSVTF